MAKIPDACVKQLSLDNKRKQEAYEKEKKQKKKESSFSTKLLSKNTNSKPAQPVATTTGSKAISLSPQRTPPHVNSIDNEQSNYSKKDPTTDRLIQQQPQYHNTTETTSSPSVNRNIFITQDRANSPSTSKKKNSKKMVNKGKKEKPKSPSIISKLKNSFSAETEASPVDCSKQTKLSSNPFIKNDQTIKK